MTDIVERLGIYAEDWRTRAASASVVHEAAQEIAALTAERDALRETLNSPETEDFVKGANLEAAHQRERWGSSHDEGKAPLDWFWLIGYLAQKAATSAMAGDKVKAKHHTISTAAALANWHLALAGSNTEMRPGIDPQQPSQGPVDQP